jgi:hypothetical protein
VISDEQFALDRSLRAIGATHREVVVVLSVLDEVDGVIELARGRPAWMNERRGKGGQWTGGNGISTVKDVHHAAARQQTGVIERAASLTPKAPETYKLPEEQRIAAVAGPQGLTPAHHEVAKMISEVRQAHEKYVADSTKDETVRARTKSLAVISSLVGGAILGGIEAKLGVPDMAAIATSIGPGVVESLYEWKKHL